MLNLTGYTRSSAGARETGVHRCSARSAILSANWTLLVGVRSSFREWTDPSECATVSVEFSYSRLNSTCACTAQVWDHRRSDRALFALPGHINGAVNSIDWHPQVPHRLASVGRDRAVRVWHADPSSPPDAGAGGDGSLLKIPVLTLRTSDATANSHTLATPCQHEYPSRSNHCACALFLARSAPRVCSACAGARSSTGSSPPVHRRTARGASRFGTCGARSCRSRRSTSRRTSLVPICTD